MARPASTLDTLPTTRRALLTVLKKRGEVGADELAEALAITPSAVRQHVSGLHGEGLVAYREQRDGPGRPRHLYRLTAAGDALFPRTYGELATELLDHLTDEDPALVERVFEKRRRRRVEGARRRLAGLDFDAKVAELARILDDDGYLADIERGDDGAWHIVEHNCAILAVALRYGTACSTELSFLREVLPDARIERVAHMVAGAHSCAYRVTPR